MSNLYETDVIAWAERQVMLLRSGQLSQLDIEHIAEEIADVGKSEQREIASRLSVLTMHLLKWQLQPERRGSSWRRTIKDQRDTLDECFAEAPSLRRLLEDGHWLRRVWRDAVAHAMNEAGLRNLPQSCPWSLAEILTQDFLPD